VGGHVAIGHEEGTVGIGIGFGSSSSVFSFLPPPRRTTTFCEIGAFLAEAFFAGVGRRTVGFFDDLAVDDGAMVGVWEFLDQFYLWRCCRPAIHPLKIATARYNFLPEEKKDREP
jgi:hypothetical protein